MNSFEVKEAYSKQEYVKDNRDLQEKTKVFDEKV